MAEKDLSILIENTTMKQGKNLLFKMCTLDGVMIGKPLFYSKTDDIVVSDKMLKFFAFNFKKLHLNDDSTVLSEDLNMDVTWALLRMQLACLMQSRISPGKMKQVPSLKGYQSTLNASVLPFCKIGYCPMIKVPIPILALCIHSRRIHKLLVIFWKSSMRQPRLM